MTVTNDTVIIQLEIPTDDLFSYVSLECRDGGLVHTPYDSHMADIDGGVSTAPSEVDVITHYGLVCFFLNRNGGWCETSYLRISPNHAAFVILSLEIESVIPCKPHNTPATAADIGNPFLRHPGVHDQPIGETMAPFSAVAVEVDGVGTTQLMGGDEFQPVGNEGRDGIKEERDVFSGDESGKPAGGGFVPAGSGVCNNGYTVDRPWRVIASSGKGRSLSHVEGGRVDLCIDEQLGDLLSGRGWGNIKKAAWIIRLPSLDNKAACNPEISNYPSRLAG